RTIARLLRDASVVAGSTDPGGDRLPRRTRRRGRARGRAADRDAAGAGVGTGARRSVAARAPPDVPPRARRRLPDRAGRQRPVHEPLRRVAHARGGAAALLLHDRRQRRLVSADGGAARRGSPDRGVVPAPASVLRRGRSAAMGARAVGGTVAKVALGVAAGVALMLLLDGRRGTNGRGVETAARAHENSGHARAPADDPARLEPASASSPALHKGDDVAAVVERDPDAKPIDPIDDELARLRTQVAELE